jgi:D-arabinose 1-dehydrogenase-like Zn-dependent alcohol dehydrogenase
MMAMLAFAAEHHIESLVDIVPFTEVNRGIERVRRGNTPARVVLQR